MKKFIAIFTAVVSVGLAGVAQATITIDFEAFPTGPFTSYTESGVTFTASGGGTLLVTAVGPNGTKGLLDSKYPMKELRADIGPGATFVSVDLGDFGSDSDRLFLEVFNAGNMSLGYTDLVIPPEFVGMKTLSLSAPNIAYVIFGAREAVDGSSVYADNFTFNPIPAPGAILLGGIGVGLVGWLRRRRTF